MTVLCKRSIQIRTQAGLVMQEKSKVAVYQELMISIKLSMFKATVAPNVILIYVLSACWNIRKKSKSILTWKTWCWIARNNMRWRYILVIHIEKDKLHTVMVVAEEILSLALTSIDVENASMTSACNAHLNFLKTVFGLMKWPSKWQCWKQIRWLQIDQW